MCAHFRIAFGYYYACIRVSMFPRNILRCFGTWRRWQYHTLFATHRAICICAVGIITRYLSTYFRSSFCLQLACTPMCRIPESIPQFLCTTKRLGHRKLITGTPRRDRSRNIQVRLLAKARTDTFVQKRRPWNGLFVLGLTSC